MKITLKLEEVAILLLSIYLFSELNFEWWWYLVLFLAPDISFLGYLFNSNIGAFFYNTFHHKGIAIILYLAGIYFQNEILQLSGLVVFGHAAFDRILGYGLKYEDSFNNTHLGMIGNKNKQ